MVNICLCDDNQVFLEKYEDCLRKVARKHNLDTYIKVFSSGEGLLEYFETFKEHYIDIVFMDILMEGMDGVETSKALRKRGFEGEIIYLTSSREYAAEAYDTYPLHYMMKQESSKKLEEVFLQALARRRDKVKDGILCKKGSIIKRVQLDDIQFMETYGRNIIIHLQQGIFEFNANMELVEDKIRGKGFIRTSRSYIVNLKYIKSIYRNKLEMYSGEMIPLGAKSSMDLKEEILRARMDIWM